MFIIHVFLFPFIAFEQWKAKVHVEEEEKCSFKKTTGMILPMQPRRSLQTEGNWKKEFKITRYNKCYHQV